MDSFEVENFRSLKHLKLEKLARVNLLVGKNNSGKTSVLEGIYTMYHIELSYWPMMNNRNSGLRKSNLRYFFYKFDDTEKVNFSATFSPLLEDNKSIIVPVWRVEISTSESSVGRLDKATEKSRDSLPKSAITSFIARLYISGRAEPYPFEISINSQAASKGEGVNVTALSDEAKRIKVEGVDFPAYERTVVHMVDTHDPIFSAVAELERLKLSKQDQKVVDVLNLIDSNIQSVDVVGDDIYLDLGEHFSMLMPASLMGDGVQRLLLIIVKMISRRGGTILLDEIDNGLHYSALRILWKGILQAAREYDVQVFATTHSTEALRHLTWVLDDEENASYRNDVAAYTLIRTDDDTVRTYRHDYEQLDYALDHGVEIRN